MNVPPLPPSDPSRSNDPISSIPPPMLPPLEAPERKVPWGPGESILVWILQFTVLGFLVFAAGGGLTGNTQQITEGILTEILAAGLAYAWVRLRFGVGLSTLGVRLQGAGADFAYGLGFGFVSWLVAVPVVSSITLRIAKLLSKGPVNPPNQIQLSAPSNAALVMFGIIAIVLAPLCEELLYRGFIHQGMRSRLAMIPASAISASIFMLAHAPFWLIFPSIFTFGFAQALLFEKRGSIVSTIAAHMLFNTIGFSAFLLSR
ncbi:MAG: CPBP family intramembrane glutamic endopeptidase [Actinomycetota bacterium]